MACVIMHNMIIENERTNPVHDDQLFFRQGPLANVDHQVPTEWAAFLTMRQEIRHETTHYQLTNDLIEHLWALRGNSS